MSDRTQATSDLAANDAAAIGIMPVTPNRVAETLRAAGFRATIESNRERCWVESASNGKTFEVNFFSEMSTDPDLVHVSFRFLTFFAECTKCDVWRLTPLCNEFNVAKRYGAAVVVTGNDSYFPALHSDVACRDGMSDEALLEAIQTYVELHDDFMVEISRSPSDYLAQLVRRHKNADRLMCGNAEDQERAAEAYMRNAEAGYGGSQAALGMLYALGLEVPKSDLLAVHYLTQAAERGHPAAFLALARMFQSAGDYREFQIQAAKFAAIAATAAPEGDEQANDAAKLCTSILDELDEDSQELALRCATEWRPLATEGGPIVNAGFLSDLHDLNKSGIH